MARLSPILSSLTGNMAIAADVVPALGQLRAVRSWTAWVNGTPDWRPILGESARRAGLLSGALPLGGLQRRANDCRSDRADRARSAPTESLKGISILAD
jgi:sarcosine oxidase subunit beta